jgi:hypothetical protein
MKQSSAVLLKGRTVRSSTAIVRRDRGAVKTLDELARRSDNRGVAGLAPRPIEALRALEDLQERERQGVEGDVPWRGYSDSMQKAVSGQMIGGALGSIPAGQIPADFASITPEFLEQVVAATGPAPLDDAARIAEAARQESAMGQQPEQWSRFEHPIASSILMSVAARIEDAIAAFAMPRQRQSIPIQILAGDLPWSLPEQQRPAIGTLATGQFTATSQLAAGDRIVVLVENGLFPLARTLAQVGVLGYQESKESGRLSEPTVQSISDAVASYATLGHSMGVPVRPTPPALSPYVAAVEDAILVFVLAHEYAHILNGDLTAHPLGETAGRQRGNHAKEYLADVAGMRITIAATSHAPAVGGAPLWGPLLFLAGLDVFLRADAAMRHEAPLVEKDPAGATPFERADNLRRAVVQSQLIGAFKDALPAGLGAFQAVLFAWDIVMPALWEMSEELSALVGGDPPSGYQAEMLQLTAIRGLWAKVRPRLATQRRIP